MPETHAEGEDSSTTGIERLQLRPIWNRATNLMGVLVAIGIVSVLFASILAEGYPVPRELEVAESTNLLLTVGINIGVLVLFIGVLLSVYGNVLRSRYERQMREEEAAAVTDGGERERSERERR